MKTAAALNKLNAKTSGNRLGLFLVKTGIRAGGAAWIDSKTRKAVPTRLGDEVAQG